MSTTPKRPTAGRPGRPGGTGRVSGTVRPGRTVRSSSGLPSRAILLGALALVAIVGVGYVAFTGASSPAYACESLWQPAATPSTAPGATPRLGYVQPQLDRTHIQPGDAARYAFCPPASGKHIDGKGTGPIRAGVYGPEDQATPMGWIHNLEHGGLVLLYRCESGDGCTEAGQRALKAFYADFPDSPICHTPPGSLGPIVAHFEEMAWPYAALLWGQVLPLQALDAATIYAYFEQQGDRANPEKFCPDPTPTPAPTGTPEPSVTAAPSSSVTPETSPSAAPSAEPSATPEASPSPS